MADTSGQALIRGIDIDKLAKGFADEEIIFKKYCTVTNTSAREIRWYKKTAGYLGGTTTTGVVGDLMDNTDQLALPTVVEQSWTRNTSYVKKYFVESPTLSDEDLKDSDIDLLTTTIRDLVRGVQRRVDVRIWNVMTESQSPTNINHVEITNEWDDYSNATPIVDILDAKSDIRSYGYNPEGAILFLNDNGHTYLLNWLISQKGASIPNFSSDKVVSGAVMEILGVNVVVSNNVTADYGALVVPQRACTWKTFTPITSGKIDDLGIGTKIRVWEEGEAILTDPKAVTLLSNIGPS